VVDGNANDDLTFSGTPLEGATVMTLSDDEGTGFSDGELSLNFVTATTIKAGKPYIVKWPVEYDEYDETVVIINPFFSGVTIINTLNNIETEYISFVGNYTPVSIGAGGDNTKLYLGAGNTLYYPSAAMNINSFRGYFQLNNGLTAGPASTSESQEIKAFHLNFGEETGIREMEDVRGKMEDAWFSLDGCRLLDKPAAKGLYIHNGVKVLIK
jgi:hypothetical protein